MTVDQSGSGTAETPANRPWWKKKRFAIPLGALVALILIGIITGDPDDREDVASEDDDVAAAEPQEPEEQEDSQPEPEPELDPAAEPGEPDQGEEPEPEPEEPDLADLWAFEPVTIEGVGDDIADVPMIDDIPLVASFEHDGSSNFAIESFDEAGSRVDLLVNEIGAYEGTVPLNFQEPVAELDIAADGAWTLTVSSLIDQPALDDDFEGAGDDVLVLETAGRLSVTHDGESNFALLAWADRADLLVNEIGAYEGTVRLPEAVALEITADGTWTLAVE